MAKFKVNERTVDGLLLEIDHHKREKQEALRENDFLRSQNMMLTEALQAIIEDKSYWSQEALSSGIVWRLENVLNQIKNNS